MGWLVPGARRRWRRLSHRAAVALVVAVAVIAPLAASGPAASEPRLIATPDADYRGFDYRTVKEVTLEACRAACLGDMQCRALTYNPTASWCFLKSDFGPLSAAPGAIAARVVDAVAPTPDVAAARMAELSYLPPEARQAITAIEASLYRRFAAPADRSHATLLAEGRRARADGRADDAALAYGRATAIAPEEADGWLGLASASLDRRPERYEDQQSARQDAVGAAGNAYLRASTNEARGRALALLGTGLTRMAAFKPALKAYRASLALAETAAVRTAYDELLAERGFRITGHQVDSDAADPRICVQFSDPLPVADPTLADYVEVARGSGLSVEPEDAQICLDGARHGERYRVRLREGLPSRDGEVLPASAEIEVFVRDRSPWVGFGGNAYVLPAGDGASIPLNSINTDRAAATVYRIGERGVADIVRDGTFLSSLNAYRAGQIAENRGETIWEGEVEIRSELNRTITTAVPIGEIVGRLEPGVYVFAARVPLPDGERSDDQATQWFVVSDLGLTALSGSDGVHALVRSLGDARPVAGARLQLIAAGNDILGEATTDAAGHAVFAPGLARGTGGMAPQLLVAETEGGDYSFLDLTKTAFDLTDRGVDGRPAPGPLDVFATTERGIYRPGETVHYTALVRDPRATAVEDLPMTLIVRRPDGVEFARRTLADRGLGGYQDALTLDPEAMRGAWRFALHADPEGAPLAETSVLVEDFEPERLDFEIKAADRPLSRDAPSELAIAARYLYGAKAPGLAVEGDVIVRPTTTLDAFPNYVFGRDDDGMETVREPLAAEARTDAEGTATIAAMLPALPPATRPLEAELVLRLADSDGRAVTRTVKRPVEADGPLIGIRPQFGSDGAPEGGNAAFDVIMVGPDGQRASADGVEWSLERLDTTYQWYRAGGAWSWEPVTTSRRVASGTIALGTDAPATVSAPVAWGRYRIEVTAPGARPSSARYAFDAGWYVAGAGSETPDVLSAALDKPAYRIGETARLHLQPRFAGTALVMVVDDRLIEMKAVEVPAEGTTVELTVGAEWGAGAYVTAALYRPMDLEARRMPSRALGLAYAPVAPGDRDLDIALDLPAEARPRRRLTIPVTIGNLKPGDAARVTVAAVDVGILNLTGFEPPAPDDWYFAQRRLGLEIRDLYGQLIDRMDGMPGRVRSGGDGGPQRLGTPPPTQRLVAFHSGIVTVGPDGTAEAGFDIPDFNGTIRVMAMAWSKDGVGHASADVIVRDPVVVAASVPRFLHVGDRSRLLVEIDNVAGPPGDYRLAVEAGAGLAIADAAERTVTLGAAEKVALNLPVTGTAPGDFALRVTLTGPDGTVLPKELTLGVRPAEEPVSRRSLVALGPGESLRLDAEPLGEFVPGTGSVTVSVGASSRIDLPGLLASLDRYPYGCAEQITSRALPLVYLNEVARTAGVAADADIRQRVDTAIVQVLAKQTSAGSFGLWGPSGSSDLWLDAYVTDFLVRAGEGGHAVPDMPRRIALDNLANRIAYAGDFTNGGEDVAYALYVLARAGRAELGDLRYYAETKLDAFATPLAKAQIGAALALYGDRPRAEAAFRAASAALAAPREDEGYRPDYGTVLRDEAAVLTLASETDTATPDRRALLASVAAEQEARSHLSTQEQAWILLAAAAMAKDAGMAALTVDGQAFDQAALHRRFDGQALSARPVTVANRGAATVDAAITATGVPLVPEPAGGSGFRIERQAFTPDGAPADLAAVGQNDRFVVTLTVTADRALGGRLMVVDRLPAGFEIENPNLSSSGDTGQYAWLEAERTIAHTEARTDRFVAALDRSAEEPVAFTVAYTVRAVSPGTFARPAATVEDMYRPDRRARTAAATVEVVGPTR